MQNHSSSDSASRSMRSRVFLLNGLIPIRKGMSAHVLTWHSATSFKEPPLHSTHLARIAVKGLRTLLLYRWIVSSASR